MEKDYIAWFETLSMNDVGTVGGKNASLGEMINQLSHAQVRVPGGFATTAKAFRDFLTHNGLTQRINASLETLDISDIKKLAETGAKIRQWIVEAPLQPDLEASIKEAFNKMQAESKGGLSVAVRSSATAEDLPDASFAGQQETYLNINGIENVLLAVRKVFASLYNDRAISYRVHKGFIHSEVALSAGVQRMVRSDIGASGVMFTLDTESGFQDVVLITASFGLGEMVVQGAVNPDEFYVHKPMLEAGKQAVIQRTLGSKAIKMIYSNDASIEDPVKVVDVSEAERNHFCLTDIDLLDLAQQAVIIEKHYGRPMDIEWAKDGIDGGLYIVQARPETVTTQANTKTLTRYHLKQRSTVLIEGRSIGQKIGSGNVRIVMGTGEMERVQPGDVLVTDMTDPDWEPVMKRASAIVTNRGGRTCHAAIIARELGIPAVVGCGNATSELKDGAEVTVSCAEGDTGYVYEGILESEIINLSLDSMPKSPVKIMMNVGNPERAFDFQALPNEGIGLARLEFIIARTIGIHPKALLQYPDLSEELRETVEKRSAGYTNPVSFYVDKIAEGVATLAAAFWPKPVIVRLSDFKSNEYSNLIGGNLYEPKEENPMLGFRGASRYISDDFRGCFELECRAMLQVREEMGLTNLQIMVPFVRTIDEIKQVIGLLEEYGLKRGENGLKVIMMCEIPSNVILADEFLKHVDGFSIGSNDLTQLTLGIDRDSGLVAGGFDERNPAVKALLHQAIQACTKAGKYIGICGQGPSDHPDLAQWLVEEGIESISLNPDTVVETWMLLAGKKV
ncbi:phosphoenolpyruvate synthase [Sulfurirhabdus autotrophica]|uniref:Phosphoenolpyruvate synthase n=1 Tax=Sulfurirhabdus autotrophica TaxID=1706046 RepID=A0A4R3YDU6_9PROT|nr:phosphoenolpyruvate synthase [Sulfurirhabdus autotrophica]TCV90200.1 phosphoenolpyruvate synthase [Sulfurirhabdus autotrophica]